MSRRPVPSTPWQVWNGSVSRKSSLESQVKGVLFVRSVQALIRTGGVSKMLVSDFLQNNRGIKNKKKIYAMS